MIFLVIDSRRRGWRIFPAILGAILLTSLPVSAQVEAPNYMELRLDSIYPAGGQAGQTVAVELRSFVPSLLDAKEIIIDGPPGITVRELKQEQDRVTALLDLSAEAVPGRRGLRIRGDRVGLTNMLFFTVGRLPEVIENEAATEPQPVTIPCVANGRINPDADVDQYQFTARAGQRIVALTTAHALDAHGQYKNYGFVDLDLQVRDAAGRVLAEAQDTIGLDPLVEFVAPADGTYLARVQHVVDRGYPQAIYRLTIGDVPVPVALFPPGGQRGTTIAVKLFGPNVAEGTAQPVTLAADDIFPLSYLGHEQTAGDVDLPFVRGDLPEILEAEPNDKVDLATVITLGTTANGRIDLAGDLDWYRLTLPGPMAVHLETMAHRFLRSPVDTQLEVYDRDGKKLAENDDGFAIEYVAYHDFQPTDSQLTFNAPAAGDYFVRVRDESGGGGPRSVYRLTAKAAEPDFELNFYPDGVPIWGPGTTACVAVQTDRLQGLDSDIRLSVEGLPEGWSTASAVSLAQTPARPSSSFYRYFGFRTFLTITAPPTAKIGDTVPFRIVGRTTHNDRQIERVALPLSLYYSSDIGCFRATPQGRVSVAKPQGPWLSTAVTELTGIVGQKLDIPVQVHEAGDMGTIGLVVNKSTAGVACAYNTPAIVPIQNGMAVATVTITPETPPGEFYVTIARTWRSDIRVGMPGPCTPLIKLTVVAK